MGVILLSAKLARFQICDMREDELPQVACSHLTSFLLVPCRGQVKVWREIKR